MPVRIKCAECGSEDVLCDAWAQWDYNVQDWVLHSVMDKPTFCNSCEGECSVEEAQ